MEDVGKDQDTININGDTKEIRIEGKTMAIILFIGVTVLVLILLLLSGEEAIADILLGVLSLNT